MTLHGRSRGRQHPAEQPRSDMYPQAREDPPERVVCEPTLAPSDTGDRPDEPEVVPQQSRQDVSRPTQQDGPDRVRYRRVVEGKPRPLWREY